MSADRKRVHTFLGIPAQVWAGYNPYFPDEPLPWSEQLGRYVTVEDIRAGIAAWLHRLDEENSRDAGASDVPSTEAGQ